jgi:hypothetical protein
LTRFFDRYFEHLTVVSPIAFAIILHSAFFLGWLFSLAATAPWHAGRLDPNAHESYRIRKH